MNPTHNILAIACAIHSGAARTRNVLCCSHSCPPPPATPAPTPPCHEQHDEDARLIGERGRQFALTYLTDSGVQAYRLAVLQQLHTNVPLRLSQHALHGSGLHVCCEDIISEVFIKWASPEHGWALKVELEYYVRMCEKLAPLMAGPECAKGRDSSAPNPLVYAAGAMCEG